MIVARKRSSAPQSRIHRLISQANKGTWTTGTRATPHTYDRTCR